MLASPRHVLPPILVVLLSYPLATMQAFHLIHYLIARHVRNPREMKLGLSIL